MQTVDLTLRELVERLSLIAADRTVAPALAMRSEPLFEVLVDKLNGVPQVDALAVVGADGHLLNYSRTFPADSLDIAERDYFKHLRDGDDRSVVIGGPAKSLSTGEPTMILARRFTGPGGAFAGAVIAVVGLTRLEDFYKAAMPADGAVTVLRRDGRILIHSPHDERKIGADLPADAPWYGCAGAERRIVPRTGIHRRHRLAGVGASAARLPAGHRRQPVGEGGAGAVAAGSDLGGGRRAAAAAACVAALLWVFGAQLRRLMRSETSVGPAKCRIGGKTGCGWTPPWTNISQGVSFFDADQKLIVCNRRYR